MTSPHPFCTNCGAPTSGTPFCIQCGAPVAGDPPAAGPVPDAGSGPVPGAGPVPSAGSGPVLAAYAPDAAAYPPGPPSFPPAASTTPPGRQRGPMLAVIAVAATVALLAAGTAVWFLALRGSDTDASPVETSVTQSHPPTGTRDSPASHEATVSEGAAPATDGGQSPAAIPPVVPGEGSALASDPGSASVSTSVSVTTVTQTVPPSTSAKPTTTAPPTMVNPLDGPETSISCGTGFIVQVASELTFDALHDHVDRLIATDRLPAHTKWAQLDNSCSIFSLKVNAFVLYAGPFKHPYDGCSARLGSPADAFIKGTTAATKSMWISCLCRATISKIPTIGKTGATNVWVGVAQRILGAHLDYDIGNINGDPANGVPSDWGRYTAATKSAVQRFQKSSGISASGTLNAATWQGLQDAAC